MTKEMPKATYAMASGGEVVVRLEVPNPRDGWDWHDLSPDGAEMLGRLLIACAQRVRRANEALRHDAGDEQP